MSKERSFNRREILDKTEQRIIKLHASLAEAQDTLREATAGQSLLIVDTNLGVSAGSIRQGLESLHTQGWGDLARLYSEKLLGSHLPRNMTEILQQFFGDEVDLRHLDIREAGNIELDDSIDAAIFTGSPANITDAVTNGISEVTMRGQNFGINHQQVLDNASELYRQAAKRKLPVIGICYGHQLVSHNRGGKVNRVGRYQIGMRDIESTEYGSSLVTGVFAQDGNLRGRIPVYHGDHVAPNPEQSAILLRTSSQEPDIIHGLVHISEGAFTQNEYTDTELIKQLLADQEHVALSVQGHPEYSGSQSLITFALQNDLGVFNEDHPNLVAGEMLGMFARFLQHYKKA